MGVPNSPFPTARGKGSMRPLPNYFGHLLVVSLLSSGLNLRLVRNILMIGVLDVVLSYCVGLGRCLDLYSISKV